MKITRSGITILHRYTRAVLYTSYIARDLGEAALEASTYGASLLEADLAGANLRKANLAKIDLRGADLAETNFARATLRSATLWGANLRKANLIGVDLRNAGLCCVNLTEANLAEADLEGADLEGADLTGASLRATNLELAQNILVASGRVGWIYGIRHNTVTGLRIKTDDYSFTIPEARAHWEHDELSLIAVNYLCCMAEAHNWGRNVAERES